MLQITPNGPWGQDEHVGMPVTQDEVLSELGVCFDAGADGVHLHPRDHTGAETLDPARSRLAESAGFLAGPLRSQIEDESQGSLDLPQFVEREVAEAGAEAGGVDRRSLLGQHACGASTDLDLGSEARWTCRGRCRSDQPGREGELVRLDDYGVPSVPLLVSVDVAGGS